MEGSKKVIILKDMIKILDKIKSYKDYENYNVLIDDNKIKIQDNNQERYLILKDIINIVDFIKTSTESANIFTINGNLISSVNIYNKELHLTTCTKIINYEIYGETKIDE